MPAGARRWRRREKARRRGNAIPPYWWAPGSFKRLLGRIRSGPSATRRADQTPHKTKSEPERSRNEDAEQRALIGTRGYDHRADEPEEESDAADAQRKADRTLAAPPPVSEGAVPNDGPERCDWYEREG